MMESKSSGLNLCWDCVGERATVSSLLTCVHGEGSLVSSLSIEGSLVSSLSIELREGELSCCLRRGVEEVGTLVETGEEKSHGQHD